MADLYGPGRLVADGLLPPHLVARNPEWLRPLVGLTPRSGHFLHVLAFEVGRSPDGSWFVLGDRTQAPSGAGFALENRIATSRVFSDYFATANVERLAGFFRNFRDALNGLIGDTDGRVGDPDPRLADRYLFRARLYRPLPRLHAPGMRGSEGRERPGDGPHDLGPAAGERALAAARFGLCRPAGTGPALASRHARAWSARSARGHADDGQCAGLGRAGGPRAARLPARDRAAAAGRAAEAAEHRDLVVRPAPRAGPCEGPYRADDDRPRASTSLPFEVDATTALGGQFRGTARDSIAAWLEEDGANLVGQEAVTLSTTPAWSDGRLVPRPMTVRIFAPAPRTAGR